MRKVVPVLVIGLSLAGCAHTKLGARTGPDEFAVARQAPLVIPPDFALTPPQPGAAVAQNTNNPSAQALDALFGGPAARSGGERATLDEAGSDSADTGVRSSAGDPATNVVDKGATTRDIVAAPEGDGRDAKAATR
jgi:hypothetical protein